MSKERDAYRLQVLREMEDRVHGAVPSEVLEAEEVVAKYRQEKADAREAIMRLRSAPPEPDLCPECWYLHGKESLLSAVNSRDPKYELMRCIICGYDERTVAP